VVSGLQLSSIVAGAFSSRQKVVRGVALTILIDQTHLYKAGSLPLTQIPVRSVILITPEDPRRR
jgi:hypothetical protein